MISLYRCLAVPAVALALGLVLGGCAAEPERSRSQPATHSAQVRRACQQVTAVSEARYGAFQRRWQQVLTAVDAGDEAASASAGEIATQELLAWAQELEQTLPQVRQEPLRGGVLSAIGRLRQLADQDDQTSAGQMLGEVTAVRDRLREPCR